MLSPYRVLDLTDERGLLCGYLLGALGADVIQIEPPEGTGARRVGPFAGERPGPERSLHWQAFGRHRRSVVLDLAREAERDRLLELARGADLLVESAAPGELGRLGLGYDRLTAANPALVYVSISPFGPDGPKAGYQATDLVIQASAGAMTLTGHPDRAPLRTGGVSAWSHAGAEAAGAALVALAERERTGRGQQVRVSAQLAANLAAGFTWLASQIGHPPARRSGGGVALGPVRLPWIWPVADGAVSLTLGFDGPTAAFLGRLLDWMVEEGALDRESRAYDWGADVRTVAAGGTPDRDVTGLFATIGSFLRARTKETLLQAALERSLLVVPVATVFDVLASPHLAARDFWVEETRGDAPAPLCHPGPFARFSRTPLGPGLPAPRLGEHTAEVLGEIAEDGAAARGAGPAARRTVAVASRSAREGSRGSAGATPGGAGSALAGLRVLDFTWVMAGPYAGRVLADHGATVVKLESETRLDLVRVLPPFQGGVPGPESSAGFWSINAGKRSLALDLSNPASRQVVLDLVRWADVVIESFAPRVMPRLGLDYETLRRERPDLVMVSTCLFGQSGPLANMAGYGTMGAALGGLVAATGWPDRPPCGPFGPYTDFIAPRFTLAAILAALDHRRRTGEGQHVDLSQVETSLHFLGPWLLDAQVNGHALDRVANDDPGMAPHGVYPAAGEDEWVAIAVRDERDWVALCEVLARPDLAGDQSLSTLEGRRARRDEVDEAIAAWSRTLPGTEVEERMQRLGVPAHVVLDTVAAARDPQLAHRRHFVRVPHRLWGEVPVESSRAELTRTPARVERAGPVLGEDTELVLRELLGYRPEEVARLREAGALR